MNVLAADGSGSITPLPLAELGSPVDIANTITFTYTADTGGMQNGTITLAVPTGLVGSVLRFRDRRLLDRFDGARSRSSGRTMTVSGITLNGGGT